MGAYDYPYREESSVDQESTAGAILNELVKSYGFRRNQDGDWDWSLSNIGKAFQEDPFWTSVDYLALAFPVLKWGKGAAALEKGAGAVKAVEAGAATARQAKRAERAGAIERAYTAGEFAGKRATGSRFSLQHRVANRVLGGERAAAIQAANRGAGLALTGAGARASKYLANPITQSFDEDYLQLVDKYGANVAEQRGIVASLQREQTLEAAAFGRHGADIQRRMARFEKKGGARAKYEKRRIGRFLEEGVGPEDNLVRGLTDEAQELFRQTYDFRNRIHTEAYKAGLISKEVYAKNLKRYWPRLYQEWIEVERSAAKAGVSPALTGTRRSKRLQARKLSREMGEHLFTRSMDPSAGIDELIDAGQLIASQKYAQGLASSVIARSTDEIMQVAQEINAGNRTLQGLHGVSDDAAATLDNLLRATSVSDEIKAERVAKILGWEPLDTLFRKAGVENYLARLPEELRGKWVDPLVADDVVKTVKWMEKPGTARKIYNGFLGYFRASKTAYNPATHARNIFGAAVFHHLAVGGTPLLVPSKGLKAWKHQDDWYRAAREAGILSETFDAEIREALGQAGDVFKRKPKGQASALDWLGAATERWFPRASGAAAKLERGAAKAERFYRGIDEVYRLDAWIRLSQKGMKAGLTREEAMAKALVETHKYIPSFAQHSRFTDAVRKGIPFASFTTESLRVWKNAMTEKPHLAFLWANAADYLTQAAGAAAGFSEKELADAQAQLPHYMQNKKLLAMPFKDADGKARFLDLSYLIPMANMVDGVRSGELFFDSLVDPSANPVFSIGAAVTTGKDPFSKRPIEPRLTQNLVTTDNPSARKLVGLGEHIAMLSLPPLAPGGYAFQNLYELARGRKSPVTGEPLEEGAIKTLLANVAGLRTYAPSVQGQILNTRKERRDATGAVTQAWRRWETAKANGDVRGMQREKERIIAAKIAAGGDGESYFAKNVKNHIPGKGKVTRSLSTKQLKEIIKRSEELGALSEQDMRLLAELKATYEGRSNR